MTQYSGYNAPTASDRIVGMVKRNPEGLLLLAAGCALLMRNGWGPGANHRVGAEQWRPSGTPSQRMSGVKDTVAEAGRNAGEYVSDVAEKVGDLAGSYVSTVSDYAGDAMSAVSTHSRDFAQQAQSGFENATEYVLERQPLAIGIIGLAAGAAAAAAFPATDVERRALGPAGERLSEAAGEVTQRLKEAGTKAGERLMGVAEERGLTREGLKEAARDVGDTFTGALSESSANDQSSLAQSQRQSDRARDAKAVSSRQPADSSKGNR